MHAAAAPVQGGAARHYLQPHPQQQQQPLINGAGRRTPARSGGASPLRRTPSKADRVLGRDPNMYADEEAGAQQPQESVGLRRLSPAGRQVGPLGGDEGYADDLLFDTSSDEEAAASKRSTTGNSASRVAEEAETRALNLVTNGGWGRSGASGILRKSPTTAGSVPAGGRAVGDGGDDDGVD